MEPKKIRVFSLLSAVFVFCALGRVSLAEAAQAEIDLLCNGKIPSDVYSTFMDHSHTMKYRLSVLYNRIGNSMEQGAAKLCKDREKQSDLKDVQLVQRILSQACIQTCDKSVDQYVKGQEKQKELFNECAMICNIHKRQVEFFLEGYSTAAKAAEDCQKKLSQTAGSAAPVFNGQQLLKDVKEVEKSNSGKTQKGAAEGK